MECPDASQGILGAKTEERLAKALEGPGKEGTVCICPHTGQGLGVFEVHKSSCYKFI